MCGSSDADSPDLPLSRYLVGMGGEQTFAASAKAPA